MNKPILVQMIPTLGGGGAEREVARVSGVLAEQGIFDIIICCAKSRGGFADDAEKTGVKVVVLPNENASTLASIQNAVKYLRKVKPTIVHCHLVRWGTIAAKLAGVPIAISTEHNLLLQSKGFQTLLDRLNARCTDRLVTVAKIITEDRHRSWGVPMAKLATIPNAVEPKDMPSPEARDKKKAELSIPADAPVIGNVARLMPQKSQQYLIEAAAEILKIRPDCYFLILGEGPCREQLEAQIKDLGLTHNVRLLGFRDDAREIMHTFNVACLSSLTEGTPVTILETMACKVPAVVTAVGGNPEVVVDGLTGFVVPPRDPKALAEGLLKLICDPELAKRMGEAGFERLMSEYSAEVNLSRLSKLYSELLAEKGLSI